MNDIFKCDTILLLRDGGHVSVAPTAGGYVDIFSDSQFFPAPDGSWVVVDYMEPGSWYVCY